MSFSVIITNARCTDGGSIEKERWHDSDHSITVQPGCSDWPDLPAKSTSAARSPCLNSYVWWNETLKWEVDANQRKNSTIEFILTSSFGGRFNEVKIEWPCPFDNSHREKPTTFAHRVGIGRVDPGWIEYVVLIRLSSDLYNDEERELKSKEINRQQIQEAERRLEMEQRRLAEFQRTRELEPSRVNDSLVLQQQEIVSQAQKLVLRARGEEEELRQRSQEKEQRKREAESAER
eukprot:TRINITY_DN17695_c0_g1_i1.p1 TRINITY_DN17695_c0_g1~~TRINITY_DN17695_c0_g1_i1.p1  ORF type:complete len:245 (-),score=37.24 TRINITY_DN17695_c0_g1_i1:48-749(-)